MRPLRRRHVTLVAGVGDARTGVVVFEAKDPGKAVDEAIVGNKPAPYGAVLWDAAVDVARVLFDVDFTGRRVFEIGAGCGLCGIVAATKGADVVCSDVDEDVFAAIDAGAAEQGVSARVHTARFDVCDRAPLPDADVVIIADLLYEPLLAAAVARRVIEARARGSVVVVGDPDRAGRVAFLKLVNDAGLGVAFTGNVAVVGDLACR